MPRKSAAAVVVMAVDEPAVIAEPVKVAKKAPKPAKVKAEEKPKSEDEAEKPKSEDEVEEKPKAEEKPKSDAEVEEEKPKRKAKKVTKKESDEEKPKAKKESDEEKPVEKAKRTRKPSAYNMMLGEFMKKIALDEAEKPKEEQLARNKRMSKAQEMYREWKETHA